MSGSVALKVSTSILRGVVVDVSQGCKEIERNSRVNPPHEKKNVEHIEPLPSESHVRFRVK